MRALLLQAAGTVVLAVAAIASTGDAAAQTSFFTPCFQTSLADTSPGVESDINATLGVGIGPDCIRDTADDQPAQYNFEQIIQFTPEPWGVAEGEDIPDGTIVGSLATFMRLGLLNNPCNNTLPVNFTLLDGSIDRSDVIPVPPSGIANRLHSLALDANNSGVPDGAEKWPAYLTDYGVRMDWDMTKLVSRQVGFNAFSISGTTLVINLLTFEPGTQVSPYLDIDTVLGYPTIVVLQDPLSSGASSDPVNDFCAPLLMQRTTEGSTGAGDYRTNPGNGAYYFTTVVLAQPDADADGVENALDPCPFTADLDWDPRAGASVGPGDGDGDGVPNSCDPFPHLRSICTAGVGLANTDEDCDGWMNRSDNCPHDGNASQTDADLDGLGDVCDDNSAERSGVLTYECLIREVVVGSGGFGQPDPNHYRPCSSSACFPFPCLCPDSASCITFTPTPSPSPSATGTPTVTPGALPSAGGAASRSAPVGWLALGGALLTLGSAAAFVAARGRSRW